MVNKSKPKQKQQVYSKRKYINHFLLSVIACLCVLLVIYKTKSTVTYNLSTANRDPVRDPVRDPTLGKWKSFMQDYFVDKYASCLAHATSSNSLYISLQMVFDEYVPTLKNVVLNGKNSCMKYAHNYSYTDNRKQSLRNPKQLLDLEKSTAIAVDIANRWESFPTVPGSGSKNVVGTVDKDLSIYLNDLQQSKINSDTFFVRNFRPNWAKRMNPLLQSMIHNNLCDTKLSTSSVCPQKVLTFGCGVAGNLRQYCGTHPCTRAVCIEASPFAHFVNTMMFPPNYEMLIGDITNTKIYTNLPEKSFDL